MKLLHWLIRHQTAYICCSLLLIVLTAVFVARQLYQKQQIDRQIPLTQAIEQLASTIEAGTINSQAMGAAILFGLDNVEARQLLQQQLKQTESLQQAMAALRQQFLAEEVLLVDLNQTVVAYAGPRQLQTGITLSGWSGVQLALEGNPNVYPRLNQPQRLIYLVAPIRDQHDAGAVPVGAVLIAVNAIKLDRVFEHWGEGEAVLLSPSKLVFSAANPEWLLKVPPFPLDLPHFIWQQQTYQLHRRSIDWPSADGEWQLVLLIRPFLWWQSATVIGSGLLAALPVAFVLLMFLILVRHEQRLLKSSALLRESHDIASLCTYELDMNTRQFLVSDEAYKLFGVPADYVLTIESWLVLVHPDDREMLMQYVRHLIEHRKSFDREYRIYRHQDKALRWMHVLGRVEYDQWGKITRIHGTAQDITKQKNIELRLRIEHEQSQRYLDTTLALMVELDREGNIVMLNRAARTILGYQERELIGRNWFDICLPQPLGRQIVWREFLELMQGQRQLAGEFENLILCRDGSTRLIAWRNTLRQDPNGQTVGTLSSGVDVTESRKLAQQLETILEKSPFGIAAFRENGSCVMVNAAYARLLDSDQHQIRQQNILRDPVWQQHGLLGLLGQSLASHESVRQDIELVLRQRTIALECILFPIYLSGELHFLLLLNDITSRHQAEQALNQSMQQLEQKELSKTRFLAAAGHDLRQPLAAANLFVNTLKYTQPNPAQLELIQRLEQSMSAFSGLLECLLDISKLDAGLIQPRLEVVPLADVFTWLDHHFAELVSERKLRLMFHFPSEPVFLYTDQELLKTILMNLVSNALKFTSRGGILIGARRRGSQLLLQVWDTGMGIAEQHLPYIFDEFYQVSNPQRNREAGLGLGLASCQRRMALLGGEVRCQSRLGYGSVFSLCLPLCSNHGQAVCALGVEQGFDANFAAGRRIVVVEDDKLLSDATTLLLQHMGAEVLLFNNAEQALVWPNVIESDYFIVDYALGGQLSGLELLQQLQLLSNKPLQAVLVTGETSSAFISNTTHCAWPVLYKPVDIGRLSYCFSKMFQ